MDDDAPGHAGEYLWNYHVRNNAYASGAAPLGLLAVAVGDPADVADLGSSIGWLQGVGTLTTDPSEVAWQAEDGMDELVIGESADFWFTTPPTAVIEGDGFVADKQFALQVGGVAVAPAPALVVTTNLDNVNGDTETSLREAINTVNSPQNLAGIWKIKFAANINGATITMDPNRGQFGLAKSVTIEGPANKVTIQRDPNTAVKHRIFEATGGNTTTLQRLILLNGDVTGEGGAVFALGNLKVQDCEIRNNRASTTGGGLAWGGGSLEITGSAINGNTATLGGGVYTSGTTVTVSSSQIGLNYASLNGGGLFITPTTAGGPTTVTLSGVDVGGNQAVGSGGGICADSGPAGGAITLTLTGGTNVHDNVVLNEGGRGGGIYLGTGTINLNDVRIGSNTADLGDGMYRANGTTKNVGYPGVTWFDDQEFPAP